MCFSLLLCLSNTFALANKDRMRSGDDSQLLMVHRHNEMPGSFMSFDANDCVAPIKHLLYKSAVHDQQ